MSDRVTLLNATGLEVRLLRPDGTLLASLWPCGMLAGVVEPKRFRLTDLVFELAGVPQASVPVNLVALGDVKGLPEEHPAVRYIVSRAAARAAVISLRNDCYVLDDPVRNDDGVILGHMALARV